MSIYSLLYTLECLISQKMQKYGPLRELNPGPPAPEAGIMPLDQVATVISLSERVSYVGVPKSQSSNFY